MTIYFKHLPGSVDSVKHEEPMQVNQQGTNSSGKRRPRVQHAYVSCNILKVYDVPQ